MAGAGGASNCKTELSRRYILADVSTGQTVQQTIVVERFAVLDFCRSRLQSDATRPGTPSGAISIPRKLRVHISSREEEDCKLRASWGVPPANLPPEFPK